MHFFKKSLKYDEAEILRLGDNVTDKAQNFGYDKAIKRNNKEASTMSVLHIKKENFDQEVLHSEKPVLVDFWASWCGPCRMVGPILDEIAGERPDIKVCKINVDEQPELASRYQIMTIPTLMVIRDGEIITRSSGAKPKGKILDMLA